MVTKVFVYFLIYPDLCRALEANCEAWQRVCDRYNLINFRPYSSVLPDPDRGDILVYSKEAITRFIEQIRREAEEGRKGEVR